MRPVTLVLAVLVLSGCATQIDSTKVELHIADLANKGGGIHTKSVRCPEGIDAHKGDMFRCDLTAEDGSSIAVEVDIINDKGDVHLVEPKALDQASVETGVVRLVTKQSGYTDVRASCPEIIPEGSGETVRCDVSGGGHTTKLTVLQTDDHGSYRLLGLLQ